MMYVRIHAVDPTLKQSILVVGELVAIDEMTALFTHD